MHNHEQISLCIIDDIKSVVEGLTSLDWQEHGITVAGTSSNGVDGLELAERVKPDIIITDIRMPKMDGLTMIRSIMEHSHSCKIILITGYTDFDYAKQAIQLGAFDLVVKPFTEEGILEAVIKAKKEILQERSRLLNVRDMELRLRESMPVLRKEFIELLIKHRTPWEKAIRRWDYLLIGLEPQNFQVMLIEIDKFQKQSLDLPIHEVELIRFAIQNIVEETLAESTRAIVFRSKYSRLVAVLNHSEALNATELGERCCKNIERYTKFTISVGVGEKVDDVSQLPDSYSQAERALAYHLFTDGNGAIGFHELPATDRQHPLQLEHKDELLLSLRSGNSERAAAILSEISGALNRQGDKPYPDYLLSLYDELAASAIRTLYELIPIPALEPMINTYKTMRAASGLTMTGLEQLLFTLCVEGAELVRRNTMTEGEVIIYKSLDYLLGRLDQNITVADCAAHVHLSGSYYSSLFKKVTGMTFVQYVTTKRMNKAKALLVGGMPVQEVAAAVGYEERRYFSDMFKKITGMTPTEFRASYHPEAPME